MKNYLFYLSLSGWLLTSLTVAHAHRNEITEGQKAFERGHFVDAIQHWEAVYTKTNVPTSLILSMQLARAYQANGDYEKALTTLQAALPKTKHDLANHALMLSMLSDLYLETQQVDLAKEHINQSIALARKTNQPTVLANVLNSVGHVLTARQHDLETITTYQEALTLAQKSHDTLLTVKITLNLLQALFHSHRYNEIKPLLKPTTQHLHDLPAHYDKALGLITLGYLIQRLQYQLNTADADLLLLAYDALNEAKQLAEHLHHSQLASYAYGYLGELYEHEKRYNEALSLTRRALFFAQTTDAQEMRYQWYWQLGRLFKAQHQLDDAITAYRHALQASQPVDKQLTDPYRDASQTFEEHIEPVYTQLQELLLQKAQATPQEEQWLLQVKDTTESLQAAALQNYFQDDCVARLQATVANHTATAKPRINQKIDDHTAILYPITLADHTELLLNLPDGTLQRFIVPVSQKKLQETVHTFLENLTIRTHYKFIVQAQQLYHWLITPLIDVLKTYRIDTLVTVPNTLLRTIPLAALHDGKHFLIENIALAITPTLTLTNTEHTTYHDSTILLSGLSESVQGFASLPNVPEELHNIQAIYQTTLLKDKEFSSHTLQEALKNTPYPIIHIASHGQFEPDPNNTFLLTYNDKLTMSRLEQLIKYNEHRNTPIELLTLSACQTAVGNDRAALGLAGVAIKAGVRSALASLWFIDDIATSTLMTAFYRHLRTSPSKAKALQQAQKTMIAQRRFRHPAFWSAFLLIGNWL